MDSPLMMDLIRPQYAPNAEVLVSGLVQGRLEARGTQSRKFRFRNKVAGDSRPVTAPTTDQERANFAALLGDLDVLSGSSHPVELVDAVVHAVTGVVSKRGSSLRASPMTEHLALSQDLSGVTGSNNPPNLGRALEAMFLMGQPLGAQGTSGGMADLWLAAARLRAESEPLLGAIDKAFGTVHPGAPFVPREGYRAATEDFWRGRFPESPFGWLHDTWTTLMDPRWSKRLPTRVWTDWSTAVLRVGLAFGYLAEMRWYELVGRCLLSREEVTVLPQLRGEVLLPWAPSRLPVKSRNVKVEIKQAVNKGTSMLQVLRDTTDGVLPDPLAELNRLRQEEGVRRAVQGALGGTNPPSFAKNTYETIIYALQPRDGGTGKDYYSLLRGAGNRYSVVDPGTEWIAVVASLACDLDTRETNIGEVRTALARLGIVPELQELVRALEEAGMARGSADADHGVRVRSAF